MTREEAITRIKDHIEIHRYHERNAVKIFEALDMAIKALEQEPCEDAVSREAAIDAALSAFSRGLLASPDIRKLPSVQPKIIRCKDCKHIQKWRSEESAKKFGQIYECARSVLNCPKPEDFCSYAERRTDG